MSSRFLVTSVLVLSLGLTAPAASFAQELEEIVVTARKVGESIQDIPLSITAFTDEDIKAAGIANVEEIAKFTPGLVISNYYGDRLDPGLRFRGMDNSTTNRQVALASAFVDGIYLPGSSQWVSMNDIERVEVVKGPQSAFFGRATFGGAINFISKTPGNEWAGDVNMTLGENGRVDVEGSVEGPIIEDKLAFRVSGRTLDYDGAWDNRAASGESLGARSTLAGSVTLFATPTDNVSIRFRTLYSEDDDGQAVNQMVRNDKTNCGPFWDPANPPAEFAGINVTPRSYFCGTLTADLLTDPLAIDTNVNVGAPGTSWPKTEYGLQRYLSLSTLNIDWDIGEYTLSSVTGSYKEKVDNMRDFFGFTPSVLVSWSTYTDETFSQELRLTSPQDERVRWMLGLYYLDLTYGDRNGGSGAAAVPCPAIFCANSFFSNIFFGGPVRGAFGGAFGVGVPDPDQEIKNQALFGSVAWDITEQLTLSLEIRRAEEELAYGNVTGCASVCPPLAAPDQPTLQLDGEFTSTTPRVILDFKPTDDTTYFLSYAEGNKPGGFNTEILQMVPSAQQVFAQTFGATPLVPEEELTNIELGVKHSFGRGYVNGTLYFMEWDNQRFQTFITGFDANGDGVFDADDGNIGIQPDFSGTGSSEIQGFELAAGVLLNDNWGLSFSWNYNDTELKEYLDAQHAAVFGTFSATGKEMPRSPKHSGVFTVNYNRPAARGGEWFGRLDSVYQGSTFTWVHNLAETEDSLLSNLRLGWRDEKYTVTVWVENLTDDDPVQISRRFSDWGAPGPLGAYGYMVTLPNPREIGVSFAARFGQ